MKDLQDKIIELMDLFDDDDTPGMADGGRIGFAAGDIVTTPQLKNILKNYGLTLSDANFSRVVKNLGVKPNEIKRKSTTWIEPSEEELKDMAEKNKIRRSKSIMELTAYVGAIIALENVNGTKATD